MVGNPTPAVTPTLLPCPFCGSRADLNEDDGKSYVGCSKIGCIGTACEFFERTAAEVAAAWNTRLAAETRGLDRLDVLQIARDHEKTALNGQWPGVQVPHYALSGLFKMMGDEIERLRALSLASPAAGGEPVVIQHIHYGPNGENPIAAEAKAAWDRVTKPTPEAAGLREALEEAKGGLGAANVLIEALSGQKSVMVETCIERIDAALAPVAARGGEDVA